MPTADSAKPYEVPRVYQKGAEMPGQFALVPPADFRLLELMRASRDAPMFICAPRKTGRTSLALDYAQRHFELDDVLWINGATAGFLEAIKGQIMLEHLGQQIAKGFGRYRLVVVDDLPLLEEREAAYFSGWIDKLLDDEIEAITITTPQQDCLQRFQSDRLLIEGTKLVRSQKWSKERIGDCLACFFDADFPQEMRVLAALMIVMGCGIVDNLRELGYEIPANSHSALKQYCPLIEIDEATGYFNAMGFLVQRLSDHLIDLLNQAPRNGRDADMSDLERSFERLTQISVHLFERAEREQSQLLLELAGTLLTCDDAGYPLPEKAKRTGAAGREASKQSGATPVVTLAGALAAAPTGAPVEALLGGIAPTLADAMAELSAEVRPEQLVIRLFGDFKIFKGGKPIEGRQLHRSKVRSLLIHLALNMGRGVSRDALLDRIWPDKDYPHAKDNFYSTWSMLNSMLSDDGRACPYLSNKQGLCRLEPGYVTTDVYEFERLSKAILFRQGSAEERIEAIYRLEQLYRGDIMSGSRIDSYVQAAQLRYRSILVDIMIEASKLFSEVGNDTNAVWFARKAYDVDPSREDVYHTLMAMQDKAGQRTSALKTYFDCKRFLSEELGILPSQKTIALYQELVLDRR